MPILRIRMLGELELTMGDQALLLPATMKARSLLAFLVTHRARAYPREQLADLLWPDSPREKALHSLSTALWHIRRALPDGNFILADAQEVRFNPGSECWLDAEVLKTAITDQLQAGRAPPNPDVLAMAVGLYGGDFLEGFYDDWCLEERYHLEGLYLTALEWLVGHYQRLEQAQEALHYAEMLLERDPLREDVYRTVIRLHVQMGHRVDALRHARRCRDILQAELGIEPTPETTALCDQLLGPVWRQATPLPPQMLRHRRDLRLEHPFFVGREAEWRELQALWDETRSGRGHLVLVSGEAGIGKSRLAEELAHYIGQRGGGVLIGRCYEHEQPLPHGPLTDLLRAALTASGQRILSRLPPWQVDMLACLVPEMAIASPPPLFRAELQQARLFEALTSFLLELARYNPLLVILEDLHWASDTMLAWLHYLARHIASAPLLLFGTYRSEEVPVAHPLYRLAFALEEDGLATCLELGHLERDALAEWLVGASDALITRVYQQSGGNPFFVLAMLRALSEVGMLRLVKGRWIESDVDAHLPIPDTVRQAIGIHLGRLSAPARSLITVAAIIGQVLNLDVLKTVWGQTEEATLEALDELLRRRLVRETAGAMAGDYEFEHHLIQEVIYDQVYPRRRQQIHRRTALVMKRLFGDRPAAAGEIARHFYAADDAEDALPYFSLAAQEASRLFAWGEAEQYMGRVLELLNRLDPQGRSAKYRTQRGQALADRAEMRYLQARLADRDADLAALATLAEAGDDDRLRLLTWIRRARYRNLDAEYEDAIAAAEEGLSLAERLGDRAARGYLLSQIGFAHYFLGQPRQALTALESALAMTPEEDRETRRHITHTLGYVHFHLGNYARAISYQQVSYTDHEACGDANGMAWAGLDIGTAYQEMGRLTEAGQYLAAHLSLARRIGARPAEAYGLIQYGSWELCQGHYVAAADCFRQALSMQEELRTEHGRVAAETGMGFATYHLGEWNEARRWLVQAIEHARPIYHRRRLVEALIGLGLTEIAANRFQAAQACLSEAVDVARASECRGNLAAGLAALARVERRLNDLAMAQSHAEEAVQVACTIAAPACEMWGELEIGLVLLARGNPAAALTHTSRAVEVALRGDEGWIGTEQVYWAHARVLRALGRTAEAIALEEQAQARVQEKASHIPDPNLRARYLLGQQVQD